MTKSLSMLAAVLLTGATAFAGSVNMDFRTDYENKTYNDDAGKPAYTKMYLQTARIDMKNKLNDTTDYRIRFRLNKTQGAVTTRDSANDTVDFFMVKTAIGDGLNLQVGKFQGMAGGNENLVAGSDTYFKSKALSELSSLWYYTGAGIDYKIAEGQKVMVHVANTPDLASIALGNSGDTATGGSFSQTRSMFAMGWEGTFGDGNMKPLVTYTTLPQAGKDKAYTFMSAGLKMKFDTTMVDAEYLSNSYADKTTAGKTDATNSLTAAVALKMDSWTPKFKYESSTVNVGGAKAADVSGLAAIAEYKPMADQDMRYHVGMTKIDTKTVATSKTASETTLIAGMKLNADFLK